MTGREWRAFDAELRARVPELAVELLGKPTFRMGQEWRWGRKGSLSVVIGGARAGMWFDHEEGRGGWFSDLVGRDLGLAREDATDWIADLTVEVDPVHHNQHRGVLQRRVRDGRF